MANLIQNFRGPKSALPTLAAGRIGYCTDTDECFIGDGAANHPINIHFIEYRILDKDTAHTADTAVGGDFRIPIAYTVLDVGAYVDSAGTTGLLTIDINESGSSILSTEITIDSGEESSVTADAAAAISDSSIAADAPVTFDIDGIHTTPGSGLVVWMKIIF